MALQSTCGDFLQFQELLKQMRDVDDKIIYSLNTSLSTDSLKSHSHEQNCKDLYDHLIKVHSERRAAIKECIIVTAKDVKQFREDREKDLDNMRLDKKFKFEQRKLRMLQSELNVEDIVKERTFKAFTERCRNFFKADSL